jgi:CPA1 family monovalent cation:H+ antiporter
MSTLHLISLVVTVAALFGWISVRWLRLPLTIGTMLLTVIAAMILAATGAHAHALQPAAFRLVQQLHFDRLILHGMLALLLFAGAFLLDVGHLIKERLVIATLAVAGTVLTAGAVAALMFGGLRLLHLPADWLACLIFGALISPTDPIAVLEMLRRVGVSPQLQAQLAGESLFNDGIGAVLFLMLLDVAHGASPSPSHLAAALVLQVGGAALLGIAAAWLASRLMSLIDAYQVEILLTLALALGGYSLAEAWRLSAPLEAVIAGIALRFFNQRHPRHRIAHESIDRFWEVVDELQNAVLFVLLGLELLAIPLGRSAIQPGILAVVAVLGVRFAVVAVLLFLLRVGSLLRVGRSHFRSSVAVLGWGGLHGGLSLALALSLPALPNTAWLRPATYVVVLFSVMVQGGSMPLLLRRFARHLPPTTSQTPSETSSKPAVA